MMKEKKIRAIALLSGGLDSILAIKLVKDQGVEVLALHFTSPFFGNPELCRQAARELGVKLKVIDMGLSYVNVIRKAKHGYGKGMNPCVDCKIAMLRLAKREMRKVKARFIVTGEVLNQRPMTQTLDKLMLIEKEAKLKRLVLRPLSAKLLPPTIPEERGWVKREKLLAIKGRSRKVQLKLAKKFKVKRYATPGVACVLTQREFAMKLRDLLENKKRIEKRDIKLLKIGRHFRVDGAKIIVGRNEEENKELMKLKKKGELAFEVKGYPSPISIICGKLSKKAITIAAKLTLYYSDCKSKKAIVKYGRKLKKEIEVKRPSKDFVDGFRVIK